jgi:hypothetical protein
MGARLDRSLAEKGMHRRSEMSLSWLYELSFARLDDIGGPGDELCQFLA